MGRMPRWLKIGLVLAVVFILIIILLIILLVVLLLIRALSGGSLPIVLQGLNDWVRSNLQPLLNGLKSIQGLFGG